ncbi:MAG: AIR synthase-related protein, partial [Beijerinckiaceae bacterium]
VHDCSDGGLAVALAEMAMASGVGCMVQAEQLDMPLHAFLFGEDQARYVVALNHVHAEAVMAEAAKAGVPAMFIGVTTGQSLTLPGEAPISLDELEAAHEGWLPGYMA